MGTGSSWGTKWPGCGINQSPQSSAKVKENIELYLYLSCICKAGYRVNFFKVLFSDTSANEDNSFRNHIR